MSTRVTLRDLPAEPWRNGQGVTRVLASGGEADARWRISIATVTDGAAFSNLPGWDRAFVPLIPDSATLIGPDGPLRVGADGAIRFDGGLPITAAVPTGIAYALNLMADAGTHELHVDRLDDTIDVRAIPLPPTNTTPKERP